MAQFSLTWDAYRQDICGGLTALQQSGEFTDMTLAADGHHVKVHQMVMALVSPYIKELIAAAKCPHPVIFLSKISYTTLCSILEYVYTGEVLISRENIGDLIDAGKDLRIKGLEDMKIELTNQSQLSQTKRAAYNEQRPISVGLFGKSQSQSPSPASKMDEEIPQIKIRKPSSNVGEVVEFSVVHDQSNTDDHDYNETHFAENDDSMDNKDQEIIIVKAAEEEPSKTMDSQIQYTTSIQGSLQIILNRFIYNLRYTSRKQTNGHRQWRCVDYSKKLKCPATVMTRDDIVVKRIGAHTHPFHDKRILKKVRDNMIYSAVHEAEKYVSKRKALGNSKDGDTTTDAE